MADDAGALVILQANDATLTFTVTDPTNGNALFDLTGAALTFWRKSSRHVADTDASAKSYACTNDPDQVAHKGQATVAIPAADNATPSVTWSRLDVVKAGKLRTANTWQLTVQPV